MSEVRVKFKPRPGGSKVMDFPDPSHCHLVTSTCCSLLVYHYDHDHHHKVRLSYITFSMRYNTVIIESAAQNVTCYFHSKFKVHLCTLPRLIMFVYTEQCSRNTRPLTCWSWNAGKTFVLVGGKETA